MIRTIRSQILLAFLAMSLITASLGLISVCSLHTQAALIDRTYDQSLMSINYARAAAADFNQLQALAARRQLATSDGQRADLARSIAALRRTMDDDLAIAVERAQSARALGAAEAVSQAVKAWTAGDAIVKSWTAGGGDGGIEPASPAQWRAFDVHAAVVGQQLDLLINYIAGDAFTYRQDAHRTLRRDLNCNLIACGLALSISGLIAWLLARRVVVTIGTASDVAKRIAAGDLDVKVPVGNGDELGALLTAMETMRSNIKTSLDREVALRRSAQTRLADALESSCDGVIVIDPDMTIALANPQASLLLGVVTGPLRVGDRARPFIQDLAARPGSTSEHAVGSATCEASLPGGRWLQLSQNATQDGGSIIVCSDITLVKAQQAALKTSNFWLDSALANLCQGVCLFDVDNHLKVYNRQFHETFRIPADQVYQGMSLQDLVERGFSVDDDASSREAFLGKLLARIARRETVSKLLHMHDGRVVAVSHRPLEDGSWLATYEDITDRAQAQQKIAFMARHDALTGLPNRASFAERVESALIAAKAGQGFALLCLDLDHFKEVNDTLGHPFGDELLRVVAASLKACISEIDMVARLGGDEFAIVQPITASVEEVSILARRIIKALSVPFEIDGHRVAVGVSIGVSMAPADGASYGKLLKNADVALYKAKADGRNTWRFFERSMDEQLQARRLLELDLREAIDNDQLEVHYQPLFDLETNRIGGVEALVRWSHPVRGAVPPAAFIPLAEEIGFITRIGDWVLERACRDAAGWPDDISLSVNVSAAQFREGQLLAKVVECLHDSGLSAHRLDLEITESALLTNNASTLATLIEIRQLGVKISMDDFGTGYSSLSYLRSFSFDRVKIDQSFTRDVCLETEASAIVRTIIALCHSLGMRTTAEGVETAEQLAFLRSEGCHEAQGFLFSRPVPATHIPAFFGLTIEAGGSLGMRKIEPAVPRLMRWA